NVSMSLFGAYTAPHFCEMRESAWPERTTVPAQQEGFSFMDSSKSQQGQQNSLESEVAVAAVEPLTQGVRAPAVSPGADGRRLDAQGKWDVSVGRSQAGKRLDAQMLVRGADYLQNPCIRWQLSRGTVPDALNGERDLGLARAIYQRRFTPGFSHTFAQTVLQLLQFFHGS